MKYFNTTGYIAGLIFIIFLAIGCKTQALVSTVPFTIEEKSYFYWVGGMKGTQGTTIRVTGKTKSLNVSFSKLFFQNREYGLAPEFREDKFVLEGSFSEFRQQDQKMHNNPAGEYGNQAPNTEKKIPFDLKADEAILLYFVNGKEGYHKISGIKQLDKVYMP